MVEPTLENLILLGLITPKDIKYFIVLVVVFVSYTLYFCITNDLL